MIVYLRYSSCLVKVHCMHKNLTCSIVASLSTSRQQDVFALVVPSCQRLEQLVTSLTGISDLLQDVPTTLIQSRCHKIVTKLTTQDCNNIVISWLYQSCWNNLVTSLIVPSSLLRVVNSLFQTCSTSNANTTCQQLVNRLAKPNFFLQCACTQV